MADNVAITAGTGTNISTDDVTTLNGGAIAAGSAQTQRMKVQYGDDSIARDVSPAFPLPTTTVDVTTTGTLAAAAQTVAIALNGHAGVSVMVSGTWVGTITWEGTVNGTTWQAVNAVAASTSSPQSTTTVNGLYRLTPSGLSQVRANMSAFTSGTATVDMRASAGAGGIYANQVLPTKIIDATTPANQLTVKAANTAVAATDSPMAVGLHPSSPLPAGANNIGTVNIGSDIDTSVSGTISATDAAVAAPAGNGTLLTGTPTAGSYVTIACPGGDSSWDMQLTGTFGGGTVYSEASFDSTNGINGNWINVNGRQTGVVNTVLGYSFTTAGLYRGNTSGTTYIRARIVGATTPSVAVVLRVSAGVGAIFLNASVPAGTNTIGRVGPQGSGTGTITTPTPAATSGTLLAANTARLAYKVWNDSNVDVLVAESSAAASATAYSFRVVAGGYYEASGTNAVYTGLVNMLGVAAGTTTATAAGSGACRVTEFI